LFFFPYPYLYLYFYFYLYLYFSFSFSFFLFLSLSFFFFLFLCFFSFFLTPMTDCLFKVIVIGGAGVGKTSIIKRYVDNVYSEHYKYTIGVDFALKRLEWNENHKILLQLWDIAGQERFGVLTRVYFKGANGACVVFDVGAANTLETALRWKNDVDEKVRLSNGSPVPTVLFANKCDLEQKIQDEEIQQFADQHGFIAWFKTSAKSNTGIEEGIEFLITRIKSDYQSLQKAPQPAVLLEAEQPQRGCCF